MKRFFWFKTTTVVDQELLESKIPVEEVDREGDQAATSIFWGWRRAIDEMDKGYGEYLDGDPRSLDNQLPPNTPPPQVEGGPHAAAATGTAFEVNAVWRMPWHPTYEHPLCRFMAFVHNQPFERYPKGTTFSQE